MDAAYTLFRHLNWVDIGFILVLIYFIWLTKGFIEGLMDLIGFLLSLVIAYRFYQDVARIAEMYFHTPQGLTQAASFFFIWFLLETVLFGLVTHLILKYIRPANEHPVNRRLGFIPGIIQAFAVFLLLTGVVFALPVKGWIKEDILNSVCGPYFVNLSQSTEMRVKSVFGKAVSESLNFLTVKPRSGESLDLEFKVSAEKLHEDPASEQIMYKRVNEERQTAGAKALEFDDSLRDLARAYARQMLQNGFFSHLSLVDGTMAADRADRAGIPYVAIGENLAYAPDVYIAHQGLMNSQGHRHNILYPDFGRVGIGVIDAGLYGKMFVQVFTD